jgi:hypothetical protein
VDSRSTVHGGHKCVLYVQVSATERSPLALVLLLILLLMSLLLSLLFLLAVAILLLHLSCRSSSA